MLMIRSKYKQLQSICSNREKVEVERTVKKTLSDQEDTLQRKKMDIFNKLAATKDV